MSRRLWWCRRGWPPTPEASRAVFAVFAQTTPLVEGISIDEAFLEVGGLRRIAGPPWDIAVQLRHEVLAQVGLPITVGIARTKFLAKVASGVAKPDGLLLVPPDGELAFLHPLPVERLWGVGRVSADQAARPRRAHGRRRGRPRRGLAGVHPRAGRRPAPARVGAQPRSAPGAAPGPAAIPSARSRPWAAAGTPPPSSTRSWPARWTGSAAGSAPAGARAAP